MQAGPTFSELLAQPGSSAPPSQPQSAAGAVQLNDAVKQAVLSSPFHQARVRKETSLGRLKTFAQKIAQSVSPNSVL